MCKIMSLCQVPNIDSVIYNQFFFFINPYPKFKATPVSECLQGLSSITTGKIDILHSCLHYCHYCCIVVDVAVDIPVVVAVAAPCCC